MKKRLAIVLSLVIITVIAVSTFATIEMYTPFSTAVASKKPFYVGVTYCGNSTTEAEQLIDKVKNYTNLFVLDSGPLMQNVQAMEQICDYAVNSDLNVIACFSTDGATTNQIGAFLNASLVWGSHFLGLYFNDEPGGHMLDSLVSFSENNKTILKLENGEVGVYELTGSGANQTFSDFIFDSSGIVIITSGSEEGITVSSVGGTNSTLTIPTETIYYPNGTIRYTTDTALTYEPNGTVFGQNGQIVTDQGNISNFEPYQQVLDSNPLLNDTDAANLYVNNLQTTLSSIGNQSYVKLFTSDYGLYWFDYQGGYNSVFAELFGTQGDAQTLALDRGAADMQNKSWGVMIEPASQSPLLLQNGNQIYNEMRQAYENGAEYAIVFNYSPSGNGTGLLQDEQIGAIQKFWKDVVQNPGDTNNIRGRDALVLPNDYGWGMRNQNDTIWGIWQPDNSSQQIWNAMQLSLAKYGSKLDIIYDDPASSSSGSYQHVFYWNQTV